MKARQIQRLKQFSSADVTEQGAKAFRDGLPDSACPYKWASNSRAGDFKRAWWNAGYAKAKREAESA